MSAIGSFATHRWLIALSLCLAVLAISCGASAPREVLILPLHKPGTPSPSTIRQLSCATTNANDLVIAWIDIYGTNSRLWECRVPYEDIAKQSSAVTPTLVDDGLLQDVNVVASGQSHGLLYTKNNQLLLRWPHSSAPRAITIRHEEVPLATQACALPSGDIFIATLLGFPWNEPPTFELVCYRIGSAETRSSVAAIVMKPTGESYPAPLVHITDHTITVGMLLTSGRVVSVSGASDVVTTPGSGG